ncbi:hypothetical protein [Candidatus Chlorohelix sp.]|uniref:hypothetical protein n=1 Tax=Candidatus Chlorohelix sp. TaxID=3139201 RepID=UPI00307125DB
MNLNTQAEIESRFKQGVDLAKQGNQGEAYRIFLEITKLNPTNEQALLWRAAVSVNPAETLACLELALKINPNNERAKAGLEWAMQRMNTAIPNTENLLKEQKIHPTNVQNETKAADIPYKRSRFQTQQVKFITPAPVSIEREVRKVANKPEKKSKRASSIEKKVESEVLQAAVPKIALTISEKVRWNAQRTANSFNDTRLALRWSLLLFLMAVCLVLAGFALAQLATGLGVAALGITLFGVYLLSRSDY